jgi:hypothetical protein
MSGTYHTNRINNHQMASCGCVLPSPLPCPPCAQISSVHRDQAVVSASDAFTTVQTTTLAVYKPSVLTATWTGYVVATEDTTAPPVYFAAELSYTTAALPAVHVPITLTPVQVNVVAPADRAIPFTVSGAVTVDLGTVTVYLRVYNSDNNTTITFELGGTLTVVTNRSCCPPLAALC